MGPREIPLKDMRVKRRSYVVVVDAAKKKASLMYVVFKKDLKCWHSSYVPHSLWGIFELGTCVFVRCSPEGSWMTSSLSVMV